MKRINVTFYDETIELLEKRAEENGGESVAHQIRELVDLALKVEEAARKNNGGDSDLNQIMMLDFLKKIMVWGLETRLLARHVVGNLSEANDQAHGDILEKYSEKAQSFVEGMINAATP